MIDDKIILENSKRLDVLYVEDDNEALDATADLLKFYFHRVESVRDGEEALQAYKAYYEKHGNYYDIVISEIKIPQLDGIALAHKIKAMNAEQSLIFMSALSDFDYLSAAIELGVDGFIQKPLEVEKFKKILHTTSQKVVDKMMMHEHYAQIEATNIEHIDLISAKEFSVAEDILADLEAHKEYISRTWCAIPLVVARLEGHEIDVEYFRSNFAIKVIEYFLGVIGAKNEAGNCPVVFIMLDYFKHKDLPLHDIFMICVHFKNTVTSYIFSRYRFNQELFDDVSLILDRNFEGVIRNYLNLKGCTKVETAKNSLAQTPRLEEEDEEEHITSYIDYVLEHDVYELQDLEEDIDTISIKVTDTKRVSVDDIIVLGSSIKRYGAILSNYHIFAKLGMKIILLGDNFQANAALLFENEEKRMNIATLLEGFVNDLITWRHEIFDNNIENPHFLDDSFFSNVDTIIMFIEYDESNVVDENESMDDADFFDF